MLQRARDEDFYQARLAQPAERKALNLMVVGSSPAVSAICRAAEPLGHCSGSAKLY